MEAFTRFDELRLLKLPFTSDPDPVVTKCINVLRLDGSIRLVETVSLRGVRDLHVRRIAVYDQRHNFGMKGRDYVFDCVPLASDKLIPITVPPLQRDRHVIIGHETVDSPGVSVLHGALEALI